MPAGSVHKDGSFAADTTDACILSLNRLACLYRTRPNDMCSLFLDDVMAYIYHIFVHGFGIVVVFIVAIVWQLHLHQLGDIWERSSVDVMSATIDDAIRWQVLLSNMTVNNSWPLGLAQKASYTLGNCVSVTSDYAILRFCFMAIFIAVIIETLLASARRLYFVCQLENQEPPEEPADKKDDKKKKDKGKDKSNGKDEEAGKEKKDKGKDKEKGQDKDKGKDKDKGNKKDKKEKGEKGNKRQQHKDEDNEFFDHMEYEDEEAVQDSTDKKKKNKRSAPYYSIRNWNKGANHIDHMPDMTKIAAVIVVIMDIARAMVCAYTGVKLFSVLVNSPFKIAKASLKAGFLIKFTQLYFKFAASHNMTMYMAGGRYVLPEKKKTSEEDHDGNDDKEGETSKGPTALNWWTVCLSSIFKVLLATTVTIVLVWKWEGPHKAMREFMWKCKEYESMLPHQYLVAEGFVQLNQIPINATNFVSRLF